MAVRVSDVSTLKTSAVAGDKNWSTLNGWASSVVRAINGLIAANETSVLFGRTTLSDLPSRTAVLVGEGAPPTIALPDSRGKEGFRVVVHRTDDSSDTQIVSAQGEVFSGVGTVVLTAGVFTQEFVSSGQYWIAL